MANGSEKIVDEDFEFEEESEDLVDETAAASEYTEENYAEEPAPIVKSTLR